MRRCSLAVLTAVGTALFFSIAGGAAADSSGTPTVASLTVQIFPKSILNDEPAEVIVTVDSNNELSGVSGVNRSAAGILGDPVQLQSADFAKVRPNGGAS